MYFSNTITEISQKNMCQDLNNYINPLGTNSGSGLSLRTIGKGALTDEIYSLEIYDLGTVIKIKSVVCQDSSGVPALRNIYKNARYNVNSSSH